MRLNKYLSHNTALSRRRADALIREGRVTIDKEVANFSSDISGKKVYIDGKEVKQKSSTAYTLLAYHKKKGELVTRSDELGRPTIFDSLGKKGARMVAVGRLDMASEGLLVLSDSVAVATALMESDLPREYIVRFSGRLDEEMKAAMDNGVVSNKGANKASSVQILHISPFIEWRILSEGSHTRLRIVINQGKNRELRRFFANFGKNIDIIRVSYGFVHLNNLKKGKARYLNSDEYKELRKFLKKDR